MSKRELQVIAQPPPMEVEPSIAISPEIYWQHPKLIPYSKIFGPGEFLFHRDEAAERLFIVLSGYIELVWEEAGEEYIVSFVGPGQFLGESILSMRTGGKRQFGARALEHVKVLSLSKRRLAALEIEEPALYLDITKAVVRNCTERLKRANALIHNLSGNNRNEQLIYLILYLTEAFGRKQTLGTEVYLPVRLIHYYMEIHPNQIQECLLELKKQKLILPAGKDGYLIPDINHLLNRIPQVIDNIPTIPWI